MSDQHNPYAPGTTAVLQKRTTGEPASATRRFWTFLVDLIAIRIGMFVLEVAYGVAYGVDALQALDGTIKWWGIYIAIYVIYYVSLEVIFGRTLGKVVTGTRVVSTSGLALSVPMAVVRTLCRLLPFEAMSFSLGETWWHDSLSRTQVLRSRGVNEEFIQSDAA